MMIGDKVKISIEVDHNDDKVTISISQGISTTNQCTVKVTKYQADQIANTIKESVDPKKRVMKEI